MGRSKRPPPRVIPDDSPEAFAKTRDLFVVDANNVPVSRMCGRFIETWMTVPVMGMALLVGCERVK